MSDSGFSGGGWSDAAFFFGGRFFIWSVPSSLNRIESEIIVNIGKFYVKIQNGLVDGRMGFPTGVEGIFTIKMGDFAMRLRRKF